MSSYTTPATALSSATSQPRAARRAPFALVGFGTVVAAVVANLLVYAIGSLIVFYNPEFVILANPSGTVIFTVVPAIVAVVLYAIMRRFARRPERTFTIISAVLLVVSIVPDITYIPTVLGASNGQTAILVLMHVVAAAVIVGMLTTLGRRPAR